MPKVNLAYGHQRLHVLLPQNNLLAVVEPRRPGRTAAEAALLRSALEQPLGSPCLRELRRAGPQVAIITSDLTRPCPSDRLLPYLLEELAAAGVDDTGITVVIALGLHRAMTREELEQTVGPKVYRRVKVINHNPQDVVRLGQTSRGTPVEIFRPVVDADIRVCVGNLELHYFAGYSGGVKAILPGCASRATIQANHAMMIEPQAAAGRLEDNPVRADLEEGAAMAGVDFVLNAVVDSQHRIVGAVAGDATVAHRHGCERVAEQGVSVIPQLADIVLASAGGFPKDLDLYQAQKALDNAAHAVRDGGIVILLAECVEGLGNKTFESWMLEARSPEDILTRLQREFALGGHKAAAVASVLKRAAVYLVSALPQELVETCGLRPFAAIEQAIEAALDQIGPTARILVLPEGGSVLPVLSES